MINEKYKLKIPEVLKSRSLAFLYEEIDGKYTRQCGFSFPYVRQKDKDLAERIVKLLNKEKSLKDICKECYGRDTLFDKE